MNKPVVFVTQQPMRKDPASGRMVPSINIGPAAEHGTMEFMTPAGAQYYDTRDLVTAIKAGLENFEPGLDSVLALGDPAIIGVCCAVLARKHDSFHILKWDRVSQRYVRVQISLH